MVTRPSDPEQTQPAKRWIDTHEGEVVRGDAYLLDVVGSSEHHVLVRAVDPAQSANEIEDVVACARALTRHRCRVDADPHV